MSNEKMTSRKFAVWIVWTVLTVIVIIASVVVMVVSHSMPETLTDLIEKVLGWFFAVSMMYLGMNVGQKAAYAVCDALKAETEEEKE